MISMCTCFQITLIFLHYLFHVNLPPGNNGPNCIQRLELKDIISKNFTPFLPGRPRCWRKQLFFPIGIIENIFHRPGSQYFCANMTTGVPVGKICMNRLFRKSVQGFAETCEIEPTKEYFEECLRLNSKYK